MIVGCLKINGFAGQKRKAVKPQAGHGNASCWKLPGFWEKKNRVDGGCGCGCGCGCGGGSREPV